ncbi:unnamed protein product [Durusdinium trenchii]|uniref:GDT1 family protein n=1 Tax=Durusdinium trenchii TaxID=1381693 RepID=A0ABP0SJS2_9DINO
MHALCIVCACALHFNEVQAVPDFPAFPAAHPDLLHNVPHVPTAHAEWGVKAPIPLRDLDPQFIVNRQAESKAVAILRSLVAGLSTSLGAGIVLLLRGSPSAGQMAFALALAAGVMLTVSLVELFVPPFFHGQWLQASLSGLFGFLSLWSLGDLFQSQRWLVERRMRTMWRRGMLEITWNRKQGNGG